MAHDHFTVHPDKIRSLSHDFTQVGKRLEGKVGTFASTAENVDGAFGVLSESTEALAKYIEMTQATVKSLQHLREQLAGYAAGLEHNAASYEHTDAQHAAGFRGE